MCVGLVTHFAQIGLVRRVNVHVLLSVAAVCEPSVASLELTLERLLSWRMGGKEIDLVRYVYLDTKLDQKYVCLRERSGAAPSSVRKRNGKKRRRRRNRTQENLSAAPRPFSSKCAHSQHVKGSRLLFFK